MKSFNIISILFSLAALGASHPTSPEGNDSADDIPFGAFPSPTESFVLLPTPTSGISPDLSLVGRAVVLNHCNFPVYIWSVGSTTRPEATVLPFGRYQETYRRDVASGGIAIKISTKRDGLLTSAPLTIFAYNLAGNGRVWYDLSDVFGDPFQGHKITLNPSSSASGITWSNGIPPRGSQIRVHDAASDLVLTLC